MAETVAAAGAAIYGALSSAAASVGSAAAGAASAVGSAATSVGTATGLTGAAVAKGLAGAALSAGVGMASKELTKPDKPDAPPQMAPTNYGKDSITPKIAQPSAPPTEGVASSNAFKAEERRRLLAGLPQASQNVFSSGGGDSSKPKLSKPRLLGGGTGQSTTGYN